jgi:hypothetical protein
VSVADLDDAGLAGCSACSFARSPSLPRGVSSVLVGLGPRPDAKDVEIAVLRHQLMVLPRPVERATSFQASSARPPAFTVGMGVRARAGQRRPIRPVHP